MARRLDAGAGVDMVKTDFREAGVKLILKVLHHLAVAGEESRSTQSSPTQTILLKSLTLPQASLLFLREIALIGRISKRKRSPIR